MTNGGVIRLHFQENRSFVFLNFHILFEVQIGAYCDVGGGSVYDCTPAGLLITYLLGQSRRTAATRIDPKTQTESESELESEKAALLS